MSRNERVERRAYDERRRRECDGVDPYFDHDASENPYSLPTRSSPRLLECDPDSPYDVTGQFHSRGNNSPTTTDYYYGRTETDVTSHLQVPVPAFVDPHGCPSQIRYGPEELQTQEETHANGQREYDYMHPLGGHRPYPLSNYYYHGGSKPSTPCGSRSPSPSRPARSRSPSFCGRRRRSKSPISGSPSPNSRQCGRRNRSRSPSPGGRCAESGGRLPPDNIPQKYWDCTNKCHLCPPCFECARLLAEDRKAWDCGPSDYRGGGPMNKGGACGSGDYDYGDPYVISRIVCPFHGTAPCPLKVGYPCYGQRPWSPCRNSPRGR